MQRKNTQYQYYDILALFTALYLQAEADKKTKFSKHIMPGVSAETQTNRLNPYLDFLNQPDIQTYTKSKDRGYLLFLAHTLGDTEFITHDCSMATRNIEISPAVRRNGAEKLIPGSSPH